LGTLIISVGRGGRVQLIFLPAQGFGVDLIPDILQFDFIANNMFVIIALPDIRGN
jgi:hypothetical protein